MSIARHHRFRITMGITPRCEYILGALEEEGECKTEYLRHIGLGYDIIDSLDRLEGKGLINIRRLNRKIRLHSLTDLGKEYLQQVKEIYK
jgi:DNA-binding MarR family transcriptional regulator